MEARSVGQRVQEGLTAQHQAVRFRIERNQVVGVLAVLAALLLSFLVQIDRLAQDRHFLPAAEPPVGLDARRVPAHPRDLFADEEAPLSAKPGGGQPHVDSLRDRRLVAGEARRLSTASLLASLDHVARALVPVRVRGDCIRASWRHDTVGGQIGLLTPGRRRRDEPTARQDGVRQERSVTV